MGKAVFKKTATDLIIEFLTMMSTANASINTFGQKQKKNVLLKLQSGAMSKMVFIQMMK